VVGGGGSSSDGTVQNCAALNPDISGTNQLMRVSFDSGTLINNYGRSDMKKNGASTIWTYNTLSGYGGADITAANWGSAGWWSGTANFDPAVWDFSGVSATRGPTLRDMPGGAQNPGIQ